MPASDADRLWRKFLRSKQEVVASFLRIAGTSSVVDAERGAISGAVDGAGRCIKCDCSASGRDAGEWCGCDPCSLAGCRIYSSAASGAGGGSSTVIGGAGGGSGGGCRAATTATMSCKFGYRCHNARCAKLHSLDGFGPDEAPMAWCGTHRRWHMRSNGDHFSAAAGAPASSGGAGSKAAGGAVESEYACGVCGRNGHLKTECRRACGRGTSCPNQRCNKIHGFPDFVCGTCGESYYDLRDSRGESVGYVTELDVDSPGAKWCRRHSAWHVSRFGGSKWDEMCYISEKWWDHKGRIVDFVRCAYCGSSDY